VSRPISLEREITKKRLVEAIENIESDLELDHKTNIDAARAKLLELRIAIETKPLIESIQ
jgi:hypothetical protein